MLGPLVWLLSRSGKLEGILSDYSLWTPLGGGEGGPGCPLVAAVAGRWSVSLESTLSLIKLYLLDHSFLINKEKLGTGLHNWNLNTQEVEAGRAEIQGYFWIHFNFAASPGHRLLRKPKKKRVKTISKPMRTLSDTSDLFLLC